MDLEHIPDCYWWGWLEGEDVFTISQQGAGKPGPPPRSSGADDSVILREIAESAYVVDGFESLLKPGMHKEYPPPEPGDLSGLSEELRKKVMENYRILYEHIDKSIYRGSELESVRQDVLKLQTAEIKENIKEERRRLVNLRHGATLAEEATFDWEETAIETLGFEIPEEDRFVSQILPPAPPPGPPPKGRGAFFVMCDACHVEGSLVPMADGSMKCIEDIKAGDEVKAFDGKDVVSGTVAEKFEYIKYEYIDIRCGGCGVSVTPAHKMFVVQDDNSLVETRADNLEVGDRFLRLDENGDGCYPVFIETINPIVAPVKVYDIEVETYHNNFVGGLLGHNSGSMCSSCDTVKGLDSFHVATGVIWTFIQEAKAINQGGRSHYMGIYGFGNGMFYPVPISEFPRQATRNPLPCGDIMMVERDFLRYWPEKDRGSGTDWKSALPAFCEDYIKFGGGDLIIVCDGDIANDRETLFSGDEADRFKSETFTGGNITPPGKTGKDHYDIALEEDPMAPTFLMKLQKYMVQNDCGTGYLFWLVPEFRPKFVCHECGADGLVFAGLDKGEKGFRLLCPSGHESIEPEAGECTAPCGHQSAFGGCGNCKYFYLVLDKMFAHGTHIFHGTSSAEICKNAVDTISEIKRGRPKVMKGGAAFKSEEVEEYDDDEED